eukprot:5359891-Amphidinium_carterae.1
MSVATEALQNYETSLGQTLTKTLHGKTHFSLHCSSRKRYSVKGGSSLMLRKLVAHHSAHVPSE